MRVGGNLLELYTTVPGTHWHAANIHLLLITGRRVAPYNLYICCIISSLHKGSKCYLESTQTLSNSELKNKNII